MDSPSENVLWKIHKWSYISLGYKFSISRLIKKKFFYLFILEKKRKSVGVLLFMYFKLVELSS